jgi:hypothetical protein
MISMAARIDQASARGAIWSQEWRRPAMPFTIRLDAPDAGGCGRPRLACRRARWRGRTPRAHRRIGAAAETVEQDAVHAMEVEVAAERLGERLDHCEGRFGARMLPDRDGAIERDDWRRRLPLVHRMSASIPTQLVSSGRAARTWCAAIAASIWYGLGRPWRTALFEHGERFLDHRPIPAGAVLILEQDWRVVRREM